MKSFFGILVEVIILAAIGVVAAAEHSTDDLGTVKKNINEKKAMMVDVREDEEWKAGHVGVAISVPLSMLEAGKESSNLAQVLAIKMPKDKIVYCHCETGRRSLQAAEHLQKMGYEVRPLKHSFKQLVEAGFTPYKPK